MAAARDPVRWLGAVFTGYAALVAVASVAWMGGLAANRCAPDAAECLNGPLVALFAGTGCVALVLFVVANRAGAGSTTSVAITAAGAVLVGAAGLALAWLAGSRGLAAAGAAGTWRAVPWPDAVAAGTGIVLLISSALAGIELARGNRLRAAADAGNAEQAGPR